MYLENKVSKNNLESYRDKTGTKQGQNGDKIGAIWTKWGQNRDKNEKKDKGNFPCLFSFCAEKRTHWTQW